MNNILNAQEAFSALQKGKNLLCRHLESDFLPLNLFPSTVFGNPDYQFCIDIEKIELAGISFTKPCTIDEMEKGQEIYVCIFPCAEIHKTKFNNSSDVLNFIRCGVVQRDEENAKLQMQAYHAFLGLDLALTINSVPGTDKKQKNKRNTTKEIEAHKDVILDAIATCVDADEVETVCSGIEQYGFNDDQIQAINTAKSAKLEILVAETSQPDVVKPELSFLYDAFKTAIETAGDESTLDAIQSRINANGELSEIEHAKLATGINLRKAFFDKTPLLLRPAVVELKADNQSDAPEIINPNDGGHYFDKVKAETAAWNGQLQELLARLPETKTPEEANALVRYTKSWTEDQRKPLLRAISRRLQEFQNPQPKAEPSLMVKIQTAPDLTTLDALEIDVGGLDPIAQPDMMRIVNTRRMQLESADKHEGQAS